MMRNWPYIIILGLLILLIPSIILSVLTPFAMVDDYGDVAMRMSWQQFKDILSTFAGHNDWRFRPGWHLSTGYYYGHCFHFCKWQ